MILLACSSGCFYTDEINQRPSIAISSPGNQMYRGDHVELSATANDPEGQFVHFTWRAYACTDGQGGADCDTMPFNTGELEDFSFDIPADRVDVALPDRNVRVVLEGKDSYGATAKPSQELVIVALDRPPSVVVARDGNFVVTPGDRAVRIYATVGDPDDGPAKLGTPTWEVFAPAGVTQVPDLVDAGTTHDPDGTHITYARDFTPSVKGRWEIRVTASDPFDATSMGSVFLDVVDPPPPCIAQVQPIVPPSGAALPITDTTLFRVPVVVDDLDVFPPQPNDPVLGVTRFQWSLQGPSMATHVAVAGATGSSFTLDPATFTPGDIVEVRVEIFDRQNTPLPCPDTDATCSTISQATCIQRQTWRVEVQ